jgi:hypothetical protein
MSTVRSMKFSKNSVKRSRRGFTVLETAVALGVSSIILVSLVLWVASLMRSTTTAIQLSSSNREAASALVLFEKDLLQVGSCKPNGTSPVVVVHTPTEFGFFADVVDPSGVPGSDELLDYVLWSYNSASSSLSRSVVPGSSTCPSSPPIPSSSLEVSSMVSQDSTAPIFSFYKNGTELQAEEDCLDYSRLCRVSTIRLRAVFDSSTVSASPVSVDVSYDILQDSQRI